MSIALTRSGFSIALSGFAVACCFLIGLQVSATTAAPSAGQTSLTINRTLKSDRMPLVPAITRNAVNGPVETNAPTTTPGPKPLLLDGGSRLSALKAVRRHHLAALDRALQGALGTPPSDSCRA